MTKNRQQILCLSLSLPLIFSACRSATFHTRSNFDEIPPIIGDLVSNHNLIRAGKSIPRETIHFSIANTSGGRWSLIQEIVAIGDEAHKNYKLNKYSIDKYNSITSIGEFGLVLARNIMEFESKNGRKMARNEQNQIVLPPNLNSQSRTHLNSALSKYSTNSGPNDGIRELLASIRDAMKSVQNQP